MFTVFLETVEISCVEKSYQVSPKKQLFEFQWLVCFLALGAPGLSVFYYFQIQISALKE